MLQEYKTIKKEAEAVEIIKKSKFIARAKPVNSVEKAENFINRIRQEHASASHNVFAYIIGLNYDIQKYNDDGEPSGTSGVPTLEAIKTKELVSVVVVVTRYFGGTLLGRGGLIRAYGRAAKNSLIASGIVKMIPHYQVSMTVDYSLAGKIQNELIGQEIKINNIDYAADVTFSLSIVPDNLHSLKRYLKDVCSGQFLWEIKGEIHVQEDV